MNGFLMATCSTVMLEFLSLSQVAVLTVVGYAVDRNLIQNLADKGHFKITRSGARQLAEHQLDFKHNLW